MQARYADGRAAVTHDATCEPGADALTVHTSGATHVWSYAQLARTDDDNGRVVLKRKPDTGERLMLEPDAAPALRAAAPKLFTAHAQGREGPRTVGAIAATAWSIAAAFLIGVPMAAGPIAAFTPARYRDQISDISWSQVNALTAYCDDSDEAATILNGVAYRMMERSNVAQRDDIWITIVDANFPNAFALPDDSIIVTDDLIAMAEHPDEVTGVIAHEIAHIEHNHVMKNVIRQIGAGIFFDVVFGGAGAGQAIAIASVNLAGLRYSRDDETDADNRGLEYLAASNIDPGALARFFGRIQEMESEAGINEIPTLLSSHPASAERAAAAGARALQGTPSMSDADWRIVRQACGNSAESEEEEPAQPGQPQQPQASPQPTQPPAQP